LKTSRLFTLLALIIPFGVQAQDIPIDSLFRELSAAKLDTQRVNTLNILCFALERYRPDSALALGLESLRLAREIEFTRGEIVALAGIASSYRELGNLASAMDYALRALRVAKDNNLSAIYTNIYSTLGNIYNDLDDFSSAIFYKRLALRHEAGERNPSVASLVNDLGFNHLRMDQWDSAIYYINKSRLLWQSSKSGDSSALLRNLGRIQDHLGHYRNALAYYRQSLSTTTNKLRFEPYIYNLMAVTYMHANQQDSCIFFAEKSIQYANNAQRIKRNIESYAVLAEAYKMKGEFNRAFEYQQLLLIMKDSLSGISTIQAIQTMTLQNKEQELARDKDRIAYENSLKLYALVTGMGVLLAVSIILYRNNQRERKDKDLLYRQKDEIQNTLTQLRSTQSQLIQSEKMASLGELTAGIAHEIQNPLNFVNNFSEVNSELISELKAAAENGKLDEVKSITVTLEENEAKIVSHGKRADAIVKGMLQHSRTSSGKKELTDINALCDKYLRLAYHGLRAKDNSFNAKFETNLDPSVGMVRVMPQEIGRVILNLVNNAFYAVTEKRKLNVEGYEPTVTVSSRKHEGKVGIRVIDNGIGIQTSILDKILHPFFTTKPTGQGTGLGLSLSYDIVKAHGGEIEIKSEEGKGSEFIIYIPL